MKLIEFHWNPTHRQLRQFGLLCVLLLPSVGWLWGASWQWIAALFGLAVIVAVAGWCRPNLIRPLFIGLTFIAAPIGIIAGEFAMLLIFFGLFLPIGLFFRLVRRDALKIKMDRTRTSYWQSKKQPANVSSYYRRF